METIRWTESLVENGEKLRKTFETPYGGFCGETSFGYTRIAGRMDSQAHYSDASIEICH